MLPFTQQQFFQVLAEYNDAIWPAQVVAYALAVLMLLAALQGAWRIALAGLALMWIWTGVGFHWLQFTTINQAAWAFGAVFVGQGALLVLAGVRSHRRSFGERRGLPAVIGWALIVYAGIGYPLLGMWAGHAYPYLPMFGVTPCPVTLFTIGMLLLASPAAPAWLLVVPLGWSVVGGSAAFLLHVPQDWPLLFCAIVVAWMIVRNHSERDASFA
jgi:hypothetical protein